MVSEERSDLRRNVPKKSLDETTPKTKFFFLNEWVSVAQPVAPIARTSVAALNFLTKIPLKVSAEGIPTGFVFCCLCLRVLFLTGG